MTNPSQNETPITALTIHQPWAHLIATGRKSIESRTWLTNHRGPLAITASVKKPDPGLCMHYGLNPDSLDYGKVIAVTNVIDSRPLTPADQDAVFACGTCGTGVSPVIQPLNPPTGYDITGLKGLILDNTQKLTTPIPCRGLQKLWKLPADVAAAVEDQFVAVSASPLVPSC